jgi:hypothetical protein
MRYERDRKTRGGLDPGELTDAEMECIRNLHENTAEKPSTLSRSWSACNVSHQAIYFLRP